MTGTIDIDVHTVNSLPPTLSNDTICSNAQTEVITPTGTTKYSVDDITTCTTNADDVYALSEVVVKKPRLDISLDTKDTQNHLYDKDDVKLNNKFDLCKPTVQATHRFVNNYNTSPHNESNNFLLNNWISNSLANPMFMMDSNLLMTYNDNLKSEEKNCFNKNTISGGLNSKLIDKQHVQFIQQQAQLQLQHMQNQIYNQIQQLLQQQLLQQQLLQQQKSLNEVLIKSQVTNTLDVNHVVPSVQSQNPFIDGYLSQLDLANYINNINSNNINPKTNIEKEFLSSTIDLNNAINENSLSKNNEIDNSNLLIKNESANSNTANINSTTPVKESPVYNSIDKENNVNRSMKFANSITKMSSDGDSTQLSVCSGLQSSSTTSTTASTPTTFNSTQNNLLWNNNDLLTSALLNSDLSGLLHPNFNIQHLLANSLDDKRSNFNGNEVNMNNNNMNNSNINSSNKQNNMLSLIANTLQPNIDLSYLNPFLATNNNFLHLNPSNINYNSLGNTSTNNELDIDVYKTAQSSNLVNPRICNNNRYVSNSRNNSNITTAAAAAIDHLDVDWDSVGTRESELASIEICKTAHTLFDTIDGTTPVPTNPVEMSDAVLTASQLTISARAMLKYVKTLTPTQLGINWHACTQRFCVTYTTREEQNPKTWTLGAYSNGKLHYKYFGPRSWTIMGLKEALRKAFKARTSLLLGQGIIEEPEDTGLSKEELTYHARQLLQQLRDSLGVKKGNVHKGLYISWHPKTRRFVVALKSCESGKTIYKYFSPKERSIEGIKTALLDAHQMVVTACQ